MTNRMVVVGGSVSTTAFVERLRELGNRERIIVIDSDPDAPYDRPPVSKHYLVGADHDDIAVDWSDLDVELIRARAAGVDTDTNTLLLEDTEGGRTLEFEKLVIATGALPARLPIEPPDTLVLRSAEDARRLRAHTDAGQSVTIIGAGAIGVELASSLAARGSSVTLVDRASGPLERLLAGHLADEATSWLESIGVSCRWNAGIAAIEHDGDTWRVVLGNGERILSDFLVSAVGARPAVAWLLDSGLLTEGALLVDDHGRVISNGHASEKIFAMGDVVTRRLEDGSFRRTESWAAARQHATDLAEDLCGHGRRPAQKPYFWTEVAGRMVQVVGTLDAAGRLILESSNPDRRSAFYRVGDEDVNAAWIGVNSQPKIARLLMS